MKILFFSKDALNSSNVTVSTLLYNVTYYKLFISQIQSCFFYKTENSIIVFTKLLSSTTVFNLHNIKLLSINTLQRDLFQKHNTTLLFPNFSIVAYAEKKFQNTGIIYFHSNKSDSTNKKYYNKMNKNYFRT